MNPFGHIDLRVADIAAAQRARSGSSVNTRSTADTSSLSSNVYVRSLIP